MPKFKYRIMSAKKFLKGTSGAKVNIIFQTLCCYLRKEKKSHANSRHCSIISTENSTTCSECLMMMLYNLYTTKTETVHKSRLLSPCPPAI